MLSVTHGVVLYWKMYCFNKIVGRNIYLEIGQLTRVTAVDAGSPAGKRLARNPPPGECTHSHSIQQHRCRPEMAASASSLKRTGPIRVP